MHRFSISHSQLATAQGPLGCGILLRIKHKKQNSGADGTSKGYPAARTKLQPAGIEGFGVLTGEITSDRIWSTTV